jgi:hypothetical protein
MRTPPEKEAGSYVVGDETTPTLPKLPPSLQASQ